MRLADAPGQAADFLDRHEIEAAALADPDARPSTEEELKRMRRVPLAKHARWRAGMSQRRFAEAYEIAIGTLRDWEQGRSEPDQTARAYLKVIAADPAGTLRALAALPAKPFPKVPLLLQPRCHRRSLAV